MKLIDLRCNGQRNPRAVAAAPVFGWRFETDATNVLQTAYRIQLAKTPHFEDVLWDSGWREAGESQQIPYAGPALESATAYSFRVRARTQPGGEGEWSDPAHFETTLLSASDWTAAYITPENEEESKQSQGRLLRRGFAIGKEVRHARAYVTAKGLYELHINGQKVGDDVLTPGWTDYFKRQPFQTYDVTEYLRSGDNAVGAMLAPGWYKGEIGFRGQQHYYGDRTALLLEMIITYADGSQSRVASGEGWKCVDGPIRFAEIYHGETYDARMEKPGWDLPGYDDAGWRGAQVLNDSKDTLIPQDGEPIRRHEVLHPVEMITTAKGECVLDFGQNLAGWVRFRLSAKAGERVVLKHAEVLDAEGNFYTANLRPARATIEYIARDGAQCYEPRFTFMGFRYVRIDAFPGTPKPEDFEVVAVHSAMPRIGAFECSDDRVNQLHSNILWGLKSNFVDVPTDCPQRDERLGWTGDAQAFISTACYLMDADRFYSKWLADLSAEQMADGGVPDVVPNVLSKRGVPASEAGNHSATGWADAAVICPWAVYLAYGDKALLERQYPSMKAWVECIRGHARDGVLWDSGFHYGDWLALDAKEGSYFGATPNDLTATAFYANSAQILSRAAKALGKDADAKAYAELFGRIREAFQREFYTPAGRLAVNTQTAHILALHFDLAPENARERTIRTLLRLLEENKGHLTTGFLGTPYFCQVLGDMGYLDEAYALLLKEDYPSWLYPLTKGATTIWEHWDGIKPDGSMWSADMNSFNHYAYGAIGDWLYRTVAGLSPVETEPGYKRIRIAPRPGGGLTHASVRYESPYGEIAVRWAVEGDAVRVEARIPANTRAVVSLDTPEGEEVHEIGSGAHGFTYARKG